MCHFETLALKCDTIHPPHLYATCLSSRVDESACWPVGSDFQNKVTRLNIQLLSVQSQADQKTLMWFIFLACHFPFVEEWNNSSLWVSLPAQARCQLPFVTSQKGCFYHKVLSMSVRWMFLVDKKKKHWWKRWIVVEVMIQSCRQTKACFLTFTGSRLQRTLAWQPSEADHSREALLRIQQAKAFTVNECLWLSPHKQ